MENNYFLRITSALSRDELLNNQLYQIQKNPENFTYRNNACIYSKIIIENPKEIYQERKINIQVKNQKNFILVSRI